MVFSQWLTIVREVGRRRAIYTVRKYKTSRSAWLSLKIVAISTPPTASAKDLRHTRQKRTFLGSSVRFLRPQTQEQAVLSVV
jgi:hypothetical protein